MYIVFTAEIRSLIKFTTEIVQN